MNESGDFQDLGNFLKKRIKGKGWSANEAARRAGISSGGISTLLRGLAKPRAETLQALAKVLDVEESRLLYLAGMLDELPTGGFDQSAAYIARRITDLPPNFREVAIDAIAAQLDAVYDLYEVHRKNTEHYEAQLRGLYPLVQERATEALSGPSEREREMTSEQLAEFHSMRRDCKGEAPDLYEAIQAEAKGRGNAYETLSQRESMSAAA